jgi:uncharacterized BrkB/YihY/UPF0761 family membrane protein
MFKFIDLAFILVVIPLRMIPLARSRGRSAVGWTLGAIGAWIATSVAVAISYAFIQSFGAFTLGWSAETLRSGIYVARAVGIMCSFAVFTLLYRRLAAKPMAVASREPGPHVA